MAALEVSGLKKSFGGLKALNDVNLSVQFGTVHAIIGPNGAGKSTLLNAFVGRLIPDEGSVVFDGISLIGKQPHEINQAGVVRVFQTPEIFGELSLLDNVLIPAFSHRDGEFKLNGWSRAAEQAHGHRLAQDAGEVRRRPKPLAQHGVDRLVVVELRDDGADPRLGLVAVAVAVLKVVEPVVVVAVAAVAAAAVEDPLAHAAVAAAVVELGLDLPDLLGQVELGALQRGGPAAADAAAALGHARQGRRHRGGEGAVAAADSGALLGVGGVFVRLVGWLVVETGEERAA